MPRNEHSHTRQLIHWLVTDNENRRLLWCILLLTQCQFIAFSILYPYPNFMPPDSYSYIRAAYLNSDINMWAIGYSKFLRLFSCITASARALTWFQYTLLVGSLTYFLFSIKFFFPIKKWLFRGLLAITLLNPLVIHIGNFVGSDALFTALSLIWFTQLMWILKGADTRLLLSHALIVLLAFTVRYNALYFPVISIITIITARLRIKAKLMAIGSIVLLIGSFIAGTEYTYYKETGATQFTAFGGWQIAANALYGYAYAKPDDPGDMPAKFRQLQTLVNRHMDSLRQMPASDRPDKEVAVYYLWDFKSPLRTYVDIVWNNDTITPYFKRWASMAPLYAAYGRYLIRRHPILFVRYFLLPNFLKYYVPPTGFMGSYIQGKTLVDPIAAVWFKWKTNRVHNYFGNKEINVVKISPPLTGIVNLVFAVTAIFFLLMKGLKGYPAHNRRVFRLLLLIWLCNMTFSVFSAPIELRYQLFPIFITLPFLTLIMAYIIKESRSPGPVQVTGGIPLKA